MVRELGLQRVIERIAGFLVPEQAVGLQRARILDRGLEIEAAIGVDRQIFAGADHLDHRFDALQIVGERLAADLHLDHRVAEIEIFLHLVLQRLHVLAGIVIAAGGIHEHLVVDRAAAVALGEQP